MSTQHSIRPKSFTLLKKRSSGGYSDKLIIELRLHSSGQDPLQVALHMPPTRAAYLGFHNYQTVGSQKIPDVIPLTDTDWGLIGGWALEVPGGLQGPLFLDVLVTNVRGVPDNTWAKYVLAASILAAGIGVGAGTNSADKVAAAVTAWMQEHNITISAAELAGAVGVGWSALKGLASWMLGGMPDCAGPVFVGRYVIYPGSLENLQYTNGVATVDLGKYQNLPVAPPCQEPDGMIELSIEQPSVPPSFAPTLPVSREIRGVFRVAAAELTGVWVSTDDVLSPQVSVYVSIQLAESSPPDLQESAFRIDVIEKVAGTEMFRRSYESVVITRVEAPIPDKTNRLAQPSEVTPLPGAVEGVRTLVDVFPSMSPPTWSTACLELESNKQSYAEISLWRVSTADDSGGQIELFYRRGGNPGWTDTAAWLGNWIPVK